MAKLTYDTLSDVPDDLRDAAKEVDGKYTVSVTSADKVKEFRDSNVKLSQERDSLSAAISQYEQVTGVPLPDLENGKLSDFAKMLESLRETKSRVDDGKLVEETSLEEAAAARVTEVTASFKAQLAEMARDRDAQKQRAEAAARRSDAMLVENHVRMTASDPDVAMHDTAVNLLLPAALEVFKVEDGGKVTPKASDGTIIYGSDGITPMSVKEWMLKEREKHSYLFRGSKGGGAAGNSDTTPGRLSIAELEKMPPAERMKYARKHNLG